MGHLWELASACPSRAWGPGLASPFIGCLGHEEPVKGLHFIFCQDRSQKNSRVMTSFLSPLLPSGIQNSSEAGILSPFHRLGHGGSGELHEATLLYSTILESTLILECMKRFSFKTDSQSFSKNLTAKYKRSWSLCFRRETCPIYFCLLFPPYLALFAARAPVFSVHVDGCALRLTHSKDILVLTFPVSVSFPASLWLMVSPPPTCVSAF